MENNSIIQIALADDEALFRRGMRLILEDYPDIRVAFEAENGEDLLQKIRQAADPPDVLLLDLKMPVLSGVEAARIIREQFPSILIVVLSSHVSKSFIINMIEIGAAAYLGKNAHPDEVIETVRTVREKGFFYNAMVMEVIRDTMSGKPIPRPTHDFEVELTAREKEVLQLICAEYTTQEIAEKLFISARTVDGHRNNLLSKLGCRNTAGLVVYAIQHNLVFLLNQ
jgi:DNA-binding NarL/FixJ family response regulator